ncbi:hypothetical protein [Paraburkholderia graminis]|uniref:hypothetical protein n=1 Tax=Paraburkholderia graminis TaxID=60548 RepID=UPI0038BDB570
MSLTYFENEDVIVTISDEAQDRLAAEQRHVKAEILMWSVAGSIAAIAGLVVKQIVGAA